MKLAIDLRAKIIKYPIFQAKIGIPQLASFPKYIIRINIKASKVKSEHMSFLKFVTSLSDAYCLILAKFIGSPNCAESFKSSS